MFFGPRKFRDILCRPKTINGINRQEQELQTSKKLIFMKLESITNLVSIPVKIFTTFMLLGIFTLCLKPGIMLAAEPTERIHATSESLLVYKQPDLTSTVVGRLIYDEMIVVNREFELPFKSGIWLKIFSPYEGFYLSTSTPLSASDKDEKARYRISYFRSSAKIIEQEKQDDTVPKEMAQEKESENKETDQEAVKPLAEEDTSQEQGSKEKGVSESSDYSPFWMKEKRKQTIIGLGAGFFTVPEEDDYTVSGTPTDIFLELMGRGNFLSKLRIGVNTVSAEKNDNKVDTSSLYTVLRIRPDQISFDNIQVFILGGIAWMKSSLSGSATESYEGIGFVYGGGATVPLLSDMGLGGQFVTFMKQADFGGEKINIGSTQVQLIINYAF